ncbi:ParA family protein [Moraxella sp. ZY210820]|uniref:ParA family protein n=1 Tax=unclassified Moraxella TaxID=2685852 RepID=UPI0027316927|nr:ParA family protein [Moraxella sp. ZY210820]WLF83041.1 ParA family protein [Moraxella sp. ZY210820]
MSNKKYAVWNNKGGVGKTFLTYNLAIEYASTHPNENVVVIDACPQANVSEIILGGNGTGENNLNKFVDSNKTIAGYIKERFRRSPLNKLGTETNYFVKAYSVNDKMPKNLYLLSGDIDLDLCSRIISHIASSPIKGAWKASRSLLIDLIESFELNPEEINKPATFFIDCNPSLANYTELALLAANRLIIPCTADAASIRGMRNLVKLIYGINLGKTDLTDDFLGFHQEATTYQFELPKLHLFIQNRSRTLDREATTAYTAHSEEIARLVKELKSKHSPIFTDFSDEVIKHVKDGNTLAAIINHEGCPLHEVKSRKYSIYGKETQANQEQIKTLLDNIENVIKDL